MKSIRAGAEQVLRVATEPIVAFLARHRVHPNLISTAGFLVTCSSGVFFHEGHVRTAGFLLLLGALFDVFDGTVARRTGLASAFGAFYDSTLDRLSEIVVYLGILSLFLQYGREGVAGPGMAYAVLLAMAGSLMISYTRARAEGLQVRCDVGLMQRAERVVLLGFAALIFGESSLLGIRGLALRVVIVLLAVLTLFTVVQRIWWVYRHTRPGKAEAAPSGEDTAPAPGASSGRAGTTAASRETPPERGKGTGSFSVDVGR